MRRSPYRDYLVFDALPPFYYGYRCYVGAVRVENRDQLPAHVRNMVRIKALNAREAMFMGRQHGAVGCTGQFAPTRLRGG